MNRQPFAAVVALKDRLSVVGSVELLASVLPKHSPTSIMPSDWDAQRFGAGWRVTFGFLESCRTMRFYGTHSAPGDYNLMHP